MISAVIGTITEKNINTINIKDRNNGIYTCEMDPADIAQLKVDSKYIFVGSLVGNRFIVKHLEIRKFLDPLYEEDLFSISGVYNLITPIDNPFEKLYEIRSDNN